MKGFKEAMVKERSCEISVEVGGGCMVDFTLLLSFLFFSLLFFFFSFLFSSLLSSFLSFSSCSFSSPLVPFFPFLLVGLRLLFSRIENLLLQGCKIWELAGGL